MPSGVERVPAFVICFSGAGRVGTNGYVVVPRELVVARCTGVLVGDAPSVRGAEATNNPAKIEVHVKNYEADVDELTWCFSVFIGFSHVGVVVDGSE